MPAGTRRCVLVTAVVASLAAVQGLATPAVAVAHGLAARPDLPIPAWLFAWAATVVLLVSFAALVLLWRRPILGRLPSRNLLPLGSWADIALGGFGIAWFALVVWAGLAGTAIPTANLAPTAIWVLFWVGVPVASVLFGDVFRLLSPWRSVARAVAWLLGRLIPEGLPAPARWPGWLGRLPAAAGLLAFGWLELASADRDDPHALALLALAYSAVQLVGMSIWGITAWSERGDSFGVLFSLIARLSPFERDEGRRLRLRVPLTGLARLQEVGWTQAVLLVVIGTTTFDGFTQGPIWPDWAQWLREHASRLGAGPTWSAEIASTLGLLGAIGLVTAIWLAGTAASAGPLGLDGRAAARAFTAVLVPIAFAYTVAHYASFLLLQGQAAGYLISDPLGTGADWFGTSSATIDYGLIGPTAVWWLQVGVLLLGHVAALMLAHDRALELAPDAREATRSQLPMLVATVAFTTLGLWLLSAANL